MVSRYGGRNGMEGSNSTAGAVRAQQRTGTMWFKKCEMNREIIPTNLQSWKCSRRVKPRDGADSIHVFLFSFFENVKIINNQSTQVPARSLSHPHLSPLLHTICIQVLVSCYNVGVSFLFRGAHFWFCL